MGGSSLGGRYGDVGGIVEAWLPWLSVASCGSVGAVDGDRRESASGSMLYLEFQGASKYRCKRCRFACVEDPGSVVDTNCGYSGDNNGISGSGAGEGHCGDCDTCVVCGSCGYSWVSGTSSTPGVCRLCGSCGICGCYDICGIYCDETGRGGK